MGAIDSFPIRKAAVLGAGVMGAQIAAHLANARIDTLLFELPADEHPNANVLRAIDNLKKISPAPLAAIEHRQHLHPCNYAEHLELLSKCDFIIEAIGERLDWKEDLYGKVGGHIGENAVLASNTSGLSINQLSKTLPESLRRRFCGVHFFNPPRYMHLVELIPGKETDERVLGDLERFLTTDLGKGVIRAKDTPNFIANRVGVFSMLATMHHAKAFGIAPDVVDALTGPTIGRPKSATFRTADLVGLDTFAHVVDTMTRQLPDDPWHTYFQTPGWVTGLIEQGALGQKTRQGVYKKEGKTIQVIDPASGDYHPANPEVHPEVLGILKMRDPAEKFAALQKSDHPEAQFLWAYMRDLFHYCAVHLATIADNARDLDLAMRWGYGWKQGPLETWQSAGWLQVERAIAEDVDAGKAMSETPLPEWVTKANDTGVYGSDGAYAPSDDNFRPRSKLPVYQRQLFPDRVLGESLDSGETVFETDAVRMWHMGDDVAILSFKTKMHVITQDVLDGVQQAIEAAEADFDALVIWHDEEPFSAGADLSQVEPVFQSGDYSVLDAAVEKFQRTSLALRYSMVPTVAAVRGLVLGGGCELLMHCDRVVAGLESYVGLVEAGVGLLPAGGGCKEFARRAARDAKGGDPFPFLQTYFKTIAMAEVAKSAEHARELGYLQPADVIVFNPYELLYVAKAQARAIAESGYRPPSKARSIPAAGASAIATLRVLAVNMYEGGFISDHDLEIANRIAHVLCGGDVAPGTPLDEDWFLRLEHNAFVELCKTEKTQERIAHTLKTGKPLRN